MKAIFIAFSLLASMAFLLSSTTLEARGVQPKGYKGGYGGASPPPPPLPNPYIGVHPYPYRRSRGPAFGNNPYRRGPAFGNNPYRRGPPPNPVASVANRYVYGTPPPNPIANTPYRRCINNPYTRGPYYCSPPTN